MAIFREFDYQGVKIILGQYEGDEYQDDFKFLDKDLAQKIIDYPLKRQKEILMTRRILSQGLPDYQLFYRENGEPYLVPEDKYISISHSFPWVAVAVSCHKIGIDIEKKQEKIIKLKPKYLHETEYAWVENQQEDEYLWAIWTIKEALYKIHSEKKWSFKSCYEVERFSLAQPENIRCSVMNGDQKDYFSASLIGVGEHLLAVVKA